MEIVLELLKGFGRLFMHPLTYFFILVAFFIGLSRVKRERKNFHVRVFDFVLELKHLFVPGIIIGLILSVASVLLGTYLSIGTIVLMAIFTVVLSGPWTFRWLSPVYIVGLTMIVSLLIPEHTGLTGVLGKWANEARQSDLPSLMVLLALLMLAEGYLIWRWGNRGTSPAIVTSKRGQDVGAHFSQKLWVVPLFVLIPGNGLQELFSWWPVLDVHHQSFSFFFVPFSIGFFQRVQGMLPVHSISMTGKRVFFVGIFIALATIAVFFYPAASVFIAGFAILVREFITIRQRLRDESSSFFFSKRERGLVVLSTIPKSPAEKMGLGVGEVIMKVNGIAISNVQEFYEALQTNRAYCKLEVADVHGEVRFAQRALYDGEHHELGILFVQDYKKRKPAVV
ncbi:PDZ domain-containing protein [Priestia koreensis]|uniref:PDZ domain-containing protein n=1 Tax=Priestia koreensis TaxID=284581 RepID=UPI0028F73A14|nr:PDZ domain-containing protein [Priestia koreensis]